eukprot:g2268.t1
MDTLKSSSKTAGVVVSSSSDVLPIVIKSSVTEKMRDRDVEKEESRCNQSDLTAKRLDRGRKGEEECRRKRQRIVPPEGMSKTAYKKMLRRQRVKEKYARVKALKKEKKRKMAEERRKRMQEDGEDVKLTDQEKEVREQRRELRIGKEEARKQEYIRKCESGQRVVVDVSFESLMTEKELRSMKQQYMFAYAANKRTKTPLKLYLSSIGGFMKKNLEKVDGYDKWVHWPDPRPYTEIFDRSELIYLTADSPNTIDSLDASKVYVVGGIVDRNRHKGLTRDKAAREGIATAKLPIGEYLKASSTKVLTTNHVVQILIHFAETSDWKAALEKAIPKRKGWESKKAKDEDDTPPGGEPKKASS